MAWSKVRAHAFQASRIGKRGELQLTQLRGILLAGKGGVHHAVLRDGDGGGIGGMVMVGMMGSPSVVTMVPWLLR